MRAAVAVGVYTPGRGGSLYRRRPPTPTKETTTDTPATNQPEAEGAADAPDAPITIASVDNNSTYTVEAATPGGAKATVLLDDGCSPLAVVSDDFVRRAGLSTETLDTPQNARDFTGAGVLRITRHVPALPIAIQGLHFILRRVLVVPTLASTTDIILGMPFRRQHGVTVDYETHAFTFPRARGPVKRFYASCTGPQDPAISATEFFRSVRRSKGADKCVYMVRLRKEGDGNTADTSTSATGPAISIPYKDRKNDPQTAVVHMPPEATTADVAAFDEAVQSVSQLCSHPNELPPERRTQFRIRTKPDHVPFARQPHRLSAAELEELRSQLTLLLERGFIKPAVSEYGAPILFKQERDKIRICYNYVRLNTDTIKDKYPLPTIDDCVDHLHGATYISTLDLWSGYHQIRIHEDDIDKSTFNTALGAYSWRVMTFGFANAPPMFQRYMDSITRHMPEVKVYLDDVVLATKGTLAQHISKLKQLLQIFKDEQLHVNIAKCAFMRKEVKYLGHIVSGTSIKADLSKTNAVTDYKRPRTAMDVRRFLGFAGYYRRFIQDFAYIAQPLTALTKKHAKIVNWSTDAERAFTTLKQRLTDTPVLLMPDLTKPFFIAADASTTALGRVLLQRNSSGVLQPVAYGSRQLTSAETNYMPWERELLALVDAVRAWRIYIHGSTASQPVTLITDHAPLKTLMTKDVSSYRQTHWKDFLQQFAPSIVYSPGTSPLMRVPDALSRQWDSDPLVRDTGTPTVINMITATNDQVYLAELPSLNTPQNHMGATTTTPTDSQTPADAEHDRTDTAEPYDLMSALRAAYKDPTFKECANKWHLKHGIYYTDSSATTIVVPDAAKTVQTRLITDMHDTPYAGHRGRDATLELLGRHYYWSTMARDVAAYVAKCHVCQLNSRRNSLPAGLLKPLPVYTTAWTSVSMDYITHLPMTRQRHDAVLVFVDRFTKAAVFVPCNSDITAKHTAALFLKHVFSRGYGLPVQLVSDRDPKFTSEFWHQLQRQLRTTLAMSSGYHPQTDGNTEIVNRTFLEYLRRFTASMHTDWEDYLHFAEFTYNNATHSSTGFSPFFMLHGFHPRTPATFHHEQGPTDATVQDFLVRQHRARVQAHKALTQARAKQKHYADRHRVEGHTYAEGDQVLVHAGPYAVSDYPKLDDRWLGPYRVVKAHDNGLSYKLDIDDGGQIHPVFHTSQLRRYHTPDQDHPTPHRADPPWAHDPEAPVYDYIAAHFRGRGRGGPLHYKVKCVGSDDLIVLKATQLEHEAPGLIEAYRAQHPEIPRARAGQPIPSADLSST